MFLGSKSCISKKVRVLLVSWCISLYAGYQIDDIGAQNKTRIVQDLALPRNILNSSVIKLRLCDKWKIFSRKSTYLLILLSEEDTQKQSIVFHKKSVSHINEFDYTISLLITTRHSISLNLLLFLGHWHVYVLLHVFRVPQSDWVRLCQRDDGGHQVNMNDLLLQTALQIYKLRRVPFFQFMSMTSHSDQPMLYLLCNVIIYSVYPPLTSGWVL